MSRPCAGIRLRRPRSLATCFAVVAGAALLAACGSSGGAASPATAPPRSASPTPVPSPYATTWPPPPGAVEVVHRFWDLVGDGRIEQAQRTLVAPGSSILQWSGEDISSARYVGLVRDSVPRGPYGAATAEFAVTVWIAPSQSLNSWGPAGDHILFEQVVRMSDGSWKMWASGTGP